MSRENGYAPIRDYAAIGDGRTVALVAKDGAIDWLCLPDFDSGAVFARLLDTEGGGSFELQPDEPFESERAYEESSNVLSTVFRTSSGTVRVTDALVLADETFVPMRELVRKVEGMHGSVPMRWRIAPKFDFGRRRTRISARDGRPIAYAGRDALVLGAWDAGEAVVSPEAIEGRFDAEPGRNALLDLAATHQEPAVIPCRADAEARLERTRGFWPRWAGAMNYEGRWKDAVARSALALKLCVFSPSGAIVAAPTTSLPEWIGRESTWDYRFTWLRDASFSLEALLNLGYREEAHAFFWWFMHASRISQPRLQVLYRINGSRHAREKQLELPGYCATKPVRIGNAAAEQLQLDVYGDVLDASWHYARHGGELDRDTGRDVAKIADYVCKIWRDPDSGIWENREQTKQFIHSKAMCWVALDRACRLAEQGVIPDRRERWRPELEAIRAFVETHGYDEELGGYVRATDMREPDGSLLTLALFGYSQPGDPRLAQTIEAVKRDLASGPFVYRHKDGTEGAFLACSFWLVDALSYVGRVDEAEKLMDESLALANDVGLFAEEIREEDGAFLGNFPQALVHLALINAAIEFRDATERTT